MYIFKPIITTLCTWSSHAPHYCSYVLYCAYTHHTHTWRTPSPCHLVISLSLSTLTGIHTLAHQRVSRQTHAHVRHAFTFSDSLFLPASLPRSFLSSFSPSSSLISLFLSLSPFTNNYFTLYINSLSFRRLSWRGSIGRESCQLWPLSTGSGDSTTRRRM